MKAFFVLSLLFACLCVVSFASIPSKSNLRFNQVAGNTLGPNSVSNENIQDSSVDRQALYNRAVSSAKIAPLAINADQVAPGAITSAGASLDLVTLFIRDADTVPSESQNSNVQMQSGVEAVQPHEAISDPLRVIVDAPDPSTSYRVEAKARGSGVILGWYPSQNGHLLRYQASRALRGLVCANVDIQADNADTDTANAIDLTVACTCDVGAITIDGTTVTPTCACEVDYVYVDTDFASSIPNCAFCTVLDCDAAVSDLPDPQCEFTFPPLDDDGDFLPDRCGSYTSVEDVNNAQEGVPVYSPSVERITIDDTGRVEMWFFGRGTVDGPHDDIEITVVVLLDEQYGA